MSRTLVCLLCLVGLSLAPLGCAEKTQVKQQTKTTSPGGGTDTKTVTVEDRKTGDLKDNNNNANNSTTTTTTDNATTPAPNP